MAGSKRQWIHRTLWTRGGQTWSACSQNIVFSFQVYGRWRMSCAGTFRNLRVSTQVGIASGSTRSMTFNKNAVQSALTASIVYPATSAADITHSVAVVAGDEACWSGTVSPTGGGDDDLDVTCEFESTVSGDAPYGWNNATNYTTTVYAPLFTGHSGSISPSLITGDYIQSPGTLKRYDVTTWGSPGGGGKTFTAVVYKNQVKQDGTGGTTDTRATLSGAGASDVTSWTGSLTLSTGDEVVIAFEAAGSPNQCAFQVGSCINHTDPNAINYFHAQPTVLNGAATQYNNLNNPLGWNATEANVRVLAPLTKVKFTALRAQLSGAPGGVTSYTFDARRDSASPGGTLSVPVVGAATSGVDSSGNVVYDNTNFFSIRSLPSGSPAGRTPRFTFAQQVYWKVPNVVGNGKAAALAAITAQNLTPVENPMPSPTVPVDDVISTSPVADIELPPGDVVTVNISTGPSSGGVGSGGARYSQRYRYGWTY